MRILAYKNQATVSVVKRQSKEQRECYNRIDLKLNREGFGEHFSKVDHLQLLVQLQWTSENLPSTCCWWNDAYFVSNPQTSPEDPSESTGSIFSNNQPEANWITCRLLSNFVLHSNQDMLQCLKTILRAVMCVWAGEQSCYLFTAPGGRGGPRERKMEGEELEQGREKDWRLNERAAVRGAR